MNSRFLSFFVHPFLPSFSGLLLLLFGDTFFFTINDTARTTNLRHTLTQTRTQLNYYSKTACTLFIFTDYFCYTFFVISSSSSSTY